MSVKNICSLAGKILIAMPQMQDARFDRALVYICGHDENGAMGLIINRQAPLLNFDNLMKQLNIPHSTLTKAMPIHIGGPVEIGRGFVLHSTDHTTTGTVSFNNNIGVTATVDMLHDIARGEGPKHKLLCLGYAGWGQGQLEGEICANGWLYTEPDEDLLFNTDVQGKWHKALDKLGVDPTMLSPTAGHA